MLTIYDYVIIGFFLVFLLAMGPIFKHFSKNDSDYFCGGAKMLWWMVGASAFMSQFSA
jgi:SSS family solute:Na+ symporter